jgi:hypothetical protein
VVTLPSSDTDEVLELLSLSPACGPHSPLSKLRTSPGSSLFIDWPKGNDMAANVYIALTTDDSSSHMSTSSAPRCTQKSCVDGSSTPQFCT